MYVLMVFFHVLVVEETKLVVLDFNLDVLCYSPKDVPLIHALPNLIIPGLVDQLTAMRKMLLPNLTSHPQVRRNIASSHLFSLLTLG